MASVEGSTMRKFIVCNFHLNINTFKYHVSCTDGKILVRIILFLSPNFSTVVPITSCIFSCRPFVVNATFSTGLVVSSGHEKEETTRPVENVALTAKGLQERKHNLGLKQLWKNW